jgi:phosphate transport system substrate-binding protein
LAYQQYPDPNKAKALRDVVRWAVTEGQKYAEDLGYVPIPTDLAQRVAAAVEQIKP